MVDLNYGVAHLHLTFGGALFTVETWSCGLRIGPVAGAFDGPPPIDALEDFAFARIDEVATKVETYWTAVAAMTSTKAKLGWVKLAAVQANGKYRDGWAPATKTFATPTAGGGGNQWPQLALAISLTTGIARGRAHTGRFYLPFGTALAPDSLGQIATSDALTVANQGADFINDLNDWSGTDPTWGANVHVMSGLGTGVRHKVTGVRVGRVADTQRRRRTSIPESYAVATTAIA